MAPPARASGCVVRELRFSEIDSEFVARWRRLETRSIEGNAFLSPDFIVPAMRYLAGCEDRDESRPLAPGEPFVIAVESDHRSSPDGEPELLALGVFEVSRGNQRMPLTHIRSWETDYSLVDGILVDARFSHDSLRSLFLWLRSQGHRWHGVSFDNRTTDSKLSAILEAAAEAAGCDWIEDWTVERAAILAADLPANPVGELYSKSRRKTLGRNRRRLESYGDVAWHMRRPGAAEYFGVPASALHEAGAAEAGFMTVGHHTDWRAEATTCCESFLTLEALGWKGAQGTAMASSPLHASFCREMATGFADGGRVLFGELHLNGRPIASSVNLISGDMLFAFKIGWNPHFADCSPGTLSEVCLMTHLPQALPQVTLVDSCAIAGSYADDLWPWRRRVTAGVFPTTWTGSVAAGALSRLKQVRHLVRSNLRREETSATPR